MEQHRQAPAGCLLIYGKHPGIVYLEPLEVRVQLNAPKTQPLDFLHFPLDIRHILVPGPQAHKLGIFFTLLRDELVDGTHLLHFGGHRAHQEAVYPRFPAPLCEHMGQSHVLHGDVVKIPH